MLFPTLNLHPVATTILVGKPVTRFSPSTAIPLPSSHEGALPAVPTPLPLSSAPAPTFFRQSPHPHTDQELTSIDVPPSSPTHPTPAGTSQHAVQLTTANLRNNEPFGDIMDAKADGIFRKWGNNFNGLSIDKSGGNFIELCNKATTMQANISAGTEHNLDAWKYYV
jgi:hypothetical protein